MKAFFNLAIFPLILICSTFTANCQEYELIQVENLGKFAPNYIEYKEDNKEWVISNGYLLFSLNDNFSKVKTYFNTYPRVHYNIQKLPTKNYYIQHFENRLIPIDRRKDRLDSSAFYIMGDSLKSIKNINPSTFVRVIKNTDETTIEANALNKCFYYGKDSNIYCNNASMGIYKTVDNISRKIFEAQSKFEVKSMECSSDAVFVAFGFKDSGFYFININDPTKIQFIKPSQEGLDVSGFYFNEFTKQLYVKESNYDDFKNFAVYNYSSGILKFEKIIKNTDWGIDDHSNVNFTFNFKNNELFLQYGLTFLYKIDLVSNKIVKDFFDLFHQKIARIHTIFYKTDTDELYFSATDIENAYTDSAINKIYKIRFNRNYFVNIIRPKNLNESDLFLTQQIKTVINELPEKNSYHNKFISTSKTDLILFALNEYKYALYNMRNGNMIKTFFPLLNIFSKTSSYREKNRIQLSPNGKYIYEWIILSGTAYNIADTLVVAISNLFNGKVSQTKFALKNNLDVNASNITWDDNDFPVFSAKEDAKYPFKKIESFYIDSNLHWNNKVSFEYNPGGVLYNSWPLKNSNFIITKESKKINGVQSLLLRGKDTLVVLFDDFENKNILFNDVGFLCYENIAGAFLFDWFDNNGKLIRKGKIANNYKIIQLSKTNSFLYVENKNDNLLYQYLLSNENLIPIQSSKNISGIQFNYNDELGVMFNDGIQVVQMNNHSLNYLYKYSNEKDYIKFHQLTKNNLVSDGRIWDLNTGQLIEASFKSLAVLSDSTYIGTTYSYELYNSDYETNSFKKVNQLKPGIKFIGENKNYFQPNEKLMTEISYSKTLLAIKNFKTGKLNALYELPFVKEFSEELEIIPFNNNKNILFKKSKFKNYWLGEDNTPDSIVSLELTTGKLSKIFTGSFSNFFKDKNDAILFLSGKDSTNTSYTFKNNEFLKLYNKINEFDCFINKSKIAYLSNKGLIIANLENKIKDTIAFKYYADWLHSSNKVFYDETEQAFFIVYTDAGIIKIDSSKNISSLILSNVVKKLLNYNEKYIVGITDNGNFTFINKKNLQEDLQLKTFIGKSFADRKFIWLTKENYYLVTPGIEKNIHFIKGSNILPVKQMDLKYNRPDKVLELLNASKEEIEFYKKIYEIRTAKQKINSILIESKDGNLDVQSFVKNSNLNISLKNNQQFSKYQVSINGCPQKIPIQNSELKEWSFKLNAGENLVYVWGEDENGNRSNYTELKYLSEKADKGKWYFLGVGVSNYQDSSQNLKYADKDIRDIAIFLKNQYSSITIDTLLNEKVTTENILKSILKLKNTQPDDKVLISFSGHGLLDTAQQFWFATNNVQFNNPSLSGFSVQQLTQTLSQIPARYRMVTLDACHSGENIIEKNATALIFDTLQSEVGSKGNTILVKKRSNTNTKDLLKTMQLLFTDQISNTGINVLAASSGSEFAFESKDWNNGVFTYSLINGWQYEKERNKSYKGIHYRDLKSFIQKNVTELTKGRQTPNTIMENGEINWWLIPKN